MSIQSRMGVRLAGERHENSIHPARVRRPWRAFGFAYEHTDHGSQRAAYEQVAVLRDAGETATVYHWETDGYYVGGQYVPAKWVLYDRTDLDDNPLPRGDA